MKKRTRLALRSLAILGAAVGCSGPLTPVAPPAPPAAYSVIGETGGFACGFLLYSLIPIYVNDRTERAYDAALGGVGADFLVDTEVTDRWYYAGIGIVLCTNVRGTGVRRGADVSMPPAGLPAPPAALPDAAPPPASPVGSGVLERFRALKAQHDSGQLSDAEYESRRQQLVDDVMREP